MFPRATPAAISLLAFFPFMSPAAEADADRDFSGVWVLDEQRSDARALTPPPSAILTVSQQGLAIQCTDGEKDARPAVRIYHTDGTPTKYKFRDFQMSSMTKWEGAALLINTIVSGPQNYVVDERWRLSRDHNVLTIKRQIRQQVGEVEAVLVYRNQRARQSGEEHPADASEKRQAAPASPEIVVPAGTKIPLALVNSLSTKHSAEGDRVYLETVFPITIDGRIVIPRGSYVIGTVTEAKRPGRIKGKGELFLRFDSLTLPNGITRDFRSRVAGTDAEASELDRKEGTIRGEGNKGGDARTVAKTTAGGTAVGGIAGSAAGHAGMGAGIGAAAGAAAGLAAVLLSRGPDLVLPKGTSFEMVLDRNVQFKTAELW
jgi:type IV secretion system protein VirB10